MALHQLTSDMQNSADGKYQSLLLQKLNTQFAISTRAYWNM